MSNRAAMDAYLRRCLDFFDDVRGLVPDLDLRDAESLLQHGGRTITWASHHRVGTSVNS